MKKSLLQELRTLSCRSRFTPEHICALLYLCLTTTYFQYSDCAMLLSVETFHLVQCIIS